ncbi:DUF1330 domain-containing protein [Nocardioides sp. W7]|uniref:DUF1330 domain-containing protein n=1 Tax=Nocardioides sp. W7 TaxID=2931390 RepID=UPI001FD1FD41|nr:DUF1330 domain-containing protein [Nocardioides sp. W7]
MTTPAYAIAHLRDVDLGPEIVTYLEQIDATLAPYGGHFIVHGGRIDAVEGEWPDDVVIIAFPDREAALAWYDSPAYQAILPLRTEHSDSRAAVLTGVPTGYRAVDKLATLLT